MLLFTCSVKSRSKHLLIPISLRKVTRGPCMCACVGGLRIKHLNVCHHPTKKGPMAAICSDFESAYPVPGERGRARIQPKRKRSTRTPPARPRARNDRTFAAFRTAALARFGEPWRRNMGYSFSDSRRCVTGSLLCWSAPFTGGSIARRHRKEVLFKEVHL